MVAYFEESAVVSAGEFLDLMSCNSENKGCSGWTGEDSPAGGV